MSNITDFQKCKKILQNDFNSMNNINKLLEYKVALIDSYNFAFRYDEFGTVEESLKRGFIIPIIDSAAEGFTAKDPFMSVNISSAIKAIDSRLDFLYFQAEVIDFLDNIQGNEGDLLIAENTKADYEKDEVMTLEELGRNISVELANIMFKCGYSCWTFFRRNNIEEYKQDLKNVLENDRDIDDVAQSINTNYDELIFRIDNAKENPKKVEMFKVRDFYCKFMENRNDELEIFVNKDKDLIKVNEVFMSKPNMEEAKKYIENIMCMEIGKITEDGKIEKVFNGQGYIYKNYENFYKREGICYVSEYDGNTIKDAGISFEGICEEVCHYLFLCGVDLNKVPAEIIETMAGDVFETLEWQFTSSLIEGDEYLLGDVEKFPKEYFINKENAETESR